MVENPKEKFPEELANGRRPLKKKKIMRRGHFFIIYIFFLH